MPRKVESKHRWLLPSNNRAVARAFVLLLLLPLAVRGNGVVTNCTEANLRAAMSGGGLVTFACDGTITLSEQIRNDTDTVIDGSGHQVTIKSPNGIPKFIVASGVTFSVINLVLAEGWGILNDGGILNLAGVEFRTNIISYPGIGGPFTPGAGAAIYNLHSGTVNATNCLFVGNSAWRTTDAGYAQGGAVFNEDGQVNLQTCNLVGNSTPGASGNPGIAGGGARGGAIANLNGTVTLDLCTFVRNSASGGHGGNASSQGSGAGGGEASGGAIYNLGTLNVKRTTFANNSLTGGNGGQGATGGVDTGRNGYAGGAGGTVKGGAVCSPGALWVDSSTFSTNSVRGGVGGPGGPGGPLWSVATDGGVGGGGGAATGSALFSGGAGSLINCSFAGNTCSGEAGGPGGPGGNGAKVGGNGGSGGNGGAGSGAIYETTGSLNLNNCTVAFNSANGGVGGSGGPGGYGANLSGQAGRAGTNVAAGGGLNCNGAKLVNTLVVSNSPGGDCSGTITDLGHNLSSDGTCNFTNAGSLNNTDPLLGPFANNGGSTLTLALLLGSPAIDAGDNSTAPIIDQRGFPRPVGLASDIGAFEFGSRLPVLAISRSGVTGLEILARANASQTCRLFASSNLVHWQCVATNQIGTNGTALFQDNCGTGEIQRFYRVVLP